MRAVVVRRAGGWDRLSVEERPSPPLGAGELRIAVRAAGVNFADVAVRMGLYSSAKKYVGWPITPGFEVAGRVREVGPGVEDVAIGDEVMAVTRFGGYASEVVVPRHQAWPLPAALDLFQAAGFPAVALTAYFALFELAHPRAGDTLLVHSAAGGVGSMLVQLGKLAGCTVVGVVRGAHKVEAARSLGADAVIDKGAADLWREARRLAPHGYDVILDANGVETLAASYAHLGSPGRLVVYGFATMLPRGGGVGRPSFPKLAWDWLRTPRFDPLDMTTHNRSVLAFNLSYLFERHELLAEGMTKLVGRVEAGALRAPPVTRFPLERVAEAHRALESGTTVGKLVLELS
ncbi:MAG: zinc-binding dehydrogenase [Deltaproteobacteria bacterium]|nr:zinc-binding dehydrogenase [Deltaproteobacteria bacterium]